MTSSEFKSQIDQLQACYQAFKPNPEETKIIWDKMKLYTGESGRQAIKHVIYNISRTPTVADIVNALRLYGEQERKITGNDFCNQCGGTGWAHFEDYKGKCWTALCLCPVALGRRKTKKYSDIQQLKDKGFVKKIFLREDPKIAYSEAKMSKKELRQLLSGFNLKDEQQVVIDDENSTTTEKVPF